MRFQQYDLQSYPKQNWQQIEHDRQETFKVIMQKIIFNYFLI